MNLVEQLDNMWYKEFSKNWDDIIFRENILSKIDENSMVLDAGAGAGIIEHMNIKGYAKTVYGVDLDERVVDNPYLDKGFVADVGNLPFEDNVFDVVFSDNVLEHLEHPLEVFNEVYRVLKPGGYFLFKTPNKFHYMPLIARCTPHKFHQFINKLRGRDEADTFPTRYKANSSTDIKNISVKAGFTESSIQLIEGRPEYLRFNFLTYLVGITYERIVNSADFLKIFRVLIVGWVKK